MLHVVFEYVGVELCEHQVPAKDWEWHKIHHDAITDDNCQNPFSIGDLTISFQGYGGKEALGTKMIVKDDENQLVVFWHHFDRKELPPLNSFVLMTTSDSFANRVLMIMQNYFDSSEASSTQVN